MATHRLQTLMRELRQSTAAPELERLSDPELLERFACQGQASALGVLVRRYGPLVHGVCRRVLHNRQDVEDAFQATFIVLAQKASTERWQNSIGNWLHGVALRQARRIHESAYRRRQAQERLHRRGHRSGRSPTVAELSRVLDEEVRCLPSDLRLPLILCCLNGHTQDQAARQLGIAERTVRYRLDKARAILQQRLRQQGYALSAAGMATLLVSHQATARAPAPLLLAATRRAAEGAAASSGLAGLEASLGLLSTLSAWPRTAAAVLLLAVGLTGFILGSKVTDHSFLSPSHEGVSDMTRKNSVQLSVENLEQRAVPAVVSGITASGFSWTYDDSAHHLKVNGTAGNDNMVIGKDFNDNIRIGLDKIKLPDGSKLKISPILTVTVRGGLGNDQISCILQPGEVKRAFLHGDAGNDYLTGDRGCFLHGGSGSDTLIGGEEAHGGSGNDSISGARRMYGDDGDDTITFNTDYDGTAPFEWYDYHTSAGFGGDGKDKFIFASAQKPNPGPIVFLGMTTDFDPTEDTAQGLDGPYPGTIVWSLP